MARFWEKGKRDVMEPEQRQWTNDDNENMLTGHEFDNASIDEDESATGDGMALGRGSIKTSLWLVLAAPATLAGRRVLKSGFREFS